MTNRQDHNAPDGYGMLPKKKGPARWLVEQGPNTRRCEKPWTAAQHLAINGLSVKPAVGSENPRLEIARDRDP